MADIHLLMARKAQAIDNCLATLAELLPDTAARVEETRSELFAGDVYRITVIVDGLTRLQVQHRRTFREIGEAFDRLAARLDELEAENRDLRAKLGE